MKHKIKMTEVILISIVITTLLGCNSSRKSILPDEGPTTKEVYDRHISGGGSEIMNTFKRDKKGNLITKEAQSEKRADKNALSDEMPWTKIRGNSIMPLNSGKSDLSTREMDALKRDFRKIQNPEIIAYVYPHLSNNEHPIPGYFTAFNLYTTDHYARSGDEGQMDTVRLLAP